MLHAAVGTTGSDVTPEPPARGGMTDHSSFPGPAQDEEPSILDPDVCCSLVTVSLEPLFACVPILPTHDDLILLS